MHVMKTYGSGGTAPGNLKQCIRWRWEVRFTYCTVPTEQGILFFVDHASRYNRV